jgi:catechol 2,3-dioxygenase-like lactoylglutathione lyase family enzyme
MRESIEKVSAITLKVADMEVSVRFYRDVLGLELLYGGTDAGFTSLRVPGSEFPIINLQLARPAVAWGRMIFYVSDVDAFWSRLKESGFDPDSPEDASWGERYFHVRDPDGHELSFARQLKGLSEA